MPHDSSDSQFRDEQERGHAPNAVWTGTIAALGIGLLCLVIMAMLVTSWTFRALFPGPPLTEAGAEWQLQDRAPGVQPNQAYDQQRVLAEEKAFLKQYAWEDKEGGIARIPIERAIEIMAQRELTTEWPVSAEAASMKESK